MRRGYTEREGGGREGGKEGGEGEGEAPER